MEAVKIRNVSKKYRIYHEKNLNLKYAFLNFLSGKKSSYYDEFWALKEISLDVKKGEALGIIGENGSGKSTLLKLMAGIIYPDHGEITVNGQIAALIEIGAGFHSELSGKENIYVNASILGFSKKEIEANMEKIIAFSGLEKFIDNPIKTYSSGMYVRLGFSIAVHVNPDILLIDEILAVGDENFQKKCLQKIKSFKDKGKTIVLVSHDLLAVEKMCDRVVLLDNGLVKAEGQPVDVISTYHKILYGKGETAIRTDQPEPTHKEAEPKEEAASKQAAPPSTPTNRWGSREAEITDIEFLTDQNKKSNVFKTGDFLKVRISYIAHQRIAKPVFGLAFYREEGIHLNGPNTKTSGYNIDFIEGKGSIEYIINSLPFLPGNYLFTASIYDYSCLHAYDHWERCFKFRVIANEAIEERYGIVYIPCQWRHHGQQ